MNQIFIRGADLPGRVRGVTVQVEDDFIVMINSCLCPETQREATAHEIRHIKLDHFYHDEPVVVNEIEANGPR